MNKPDHPRILVIDMTRIGDATATGELKETLFRGWESEKICQLYHVDHTTLGLDLPDNPSTHEMPQGQEAIYSAIKNFRPDVILYRPTPKTYNLHSLALTLIKRLDKPLVTWIMDDWPCAFAKESPQAAAALDADWRWLLAKSSARFSISQQMSDAFKTRYGYDFTPIANGVELTHWPKAVLKSESKPISVRYAGSLASNMTLNSVLLIAQAIEALAQDGIEISFQIKTRAIWRDNAKPHFQGLTYTSFIVADLERSKYRKWLSEADIVVIAYNFDADSKDYIQYSLANKLPECLASGAAVLAIGPSSVATIDVLASLECAQCITDNDIDTVIKALGELASLPEKRFRLAKAAQKVAEEKFDIQSKRHLLTEELTRSAAYKPISKIMVSEEPRAVHAHVDETAVIAHLLSCRRGNAHIMLDVGAHSGTSATYFHQLGWTIHCFEPDPKNREKLQSRFRNKPNITIDTRAVSDKEQTGVPFFTSEESTGISGLSAFRSTHEKSGLVDITTVKNITKEKSLTNIDFLKIDVEGFDFSVLRGVPWDRLSPDVIEAEFEDAKTVPLGHTWRDIAIFLQNKGYAVYISEWHPIIRYGIPHDWRRVIAFDDSMELSDNAWGNFLAFRQDPGLRAVEAAFSTMMKYRSDSFNKTQPSQSLNEHHLPSTTQETRPFYAPLGNAIRRISPRSFALLQSMRRFLFALWQRRQ